MFNILSHQGNANQNCFEISSYTNFNETNDGSFWQGYGIGEHSFIACGSRNLYSHYRNLCGGSSGRWELTYVKIQLYPHTQRIFHPTIRTLMLPCSLLLYSLYSEIRINLDVPQQINEERKYSTFT